VFRTVDRLLARPALSLTRRRGLAADGRDVAAWVRPVGWLAAVWLLVRGVAILDLPAEAAGAVLAVLVPAFWLAIALAVYQLIDPVMKLVAGAAASREGEATFGSMGFPILALVLKIVVVVSGLAAVLRLFNFDVGTVLTGLGLGGLAFALAAQDTLKNFFGSVMLVADRTFRVGDLVKIGENEGVVETVGLRSTRLRGPDDSLLTVPNSDLTTAHVINFGARRFRRFRTTMTVPHGTPPDLLVRLRDGILGLIRGNPLVRPQKYEVAVNDLAAPGVEILIQVFFDVPDFHAELSARDGLVLDTLRLAERLGVSLDSPTVVLEREQQAGDGKAAGRPSPLPAP
jgi:MscS family membrane protein